METPRIRHANVEADENLVRQLMSRYLPFWPLFLILFVICGISAKIYLRYAKPVYEVTASLLIKDEKKGVDDQSLMEQLDLFGSKKFVENEISVVQSKILMRQVVRNLNLYAPIGVKGRITSTSGYTSSPVILQARNPDSLKTTDEIGNVMFAYDSASATVVLGGQHLKMGEWFTDTLGNTLRFLANPNYAPPKKKKPLFYNIFSIKATADAMTDGLVAGQATKLASIINLTYKDENPKRGEDVLNQLIKEYERANIEDKNSLALNTLNFINGRIALVSVELDSVEKGVQKYKKDNNIIDIDAQGQMYLDNVGDNDQKLSQINVQMAVLDTVENYVLTKNGKGVIVPSTFGLNDDPELTTLLGQLYGLEVQYEGLRKTTAENNPILISLRNQMEKIKPAILDNIASQRRSLEAGKLTMTRIANNYASILNTIPEKERGLVNISRQQTIKNDLYSFLLQKREETAMSYQSAVSDTRVVDDPEAAPKPVSPKHMLIYLTAVIIALGLGALVVAVREVVNQNIVFRKEIEQLTSIPIIGEIMYDPSDSVFVINEGSRTAIAEQFRHLRTLLAYIGINQQKKKILITSSISGEGKSFISINLALTLAMRDKKVAILELDLRNPQIARHFNINTKVGLTNYFVGDVDAEHLIKSTDVNPNLFIIPCGPIPPNPSEIILNGRLQGLLEYLEDAFDYIIVDAAPIGPVTDAYVISTMVDATLFVVRHGITPKILISRLDQTLRINPLKNVALVFNAVKSRGMGAYGYGYGYNNGYGYGYKYNTPNGKKGKKIRLFSSGATKKT